MTTQAQQDIRDEPVVVGSSLIDSVPERLGRDHQHYLVEYGIRYDDGALVFHFYPPKDRTDWEPGWYMDKRLERALAVWRDAGAQYFADYIEEFESFCIVVKSAEFSDATVHRFFDSVDSPL